MGGFYFQQKLERDLVLGAIRRSCSKQSSQDRKGAGLARQSCVKRSILYQRRLLDHSRHD